MPELRGVPPGRAGRLWLSQRLRTAHRAVTLLDRKLRILRAEQERFTLIAERTAADWAAAQAVARQWLVRAALLGGQRGIRLATTDALADVAVEWGAVMGVRYPVEGTFRPSHGVPGDRRVGTAALIEARTAHEAALQAAVAHAVATAACRTVDMEVMQTRRRLHAIADRWVPRLEAALHELTERLDETERSETVRLRWAARPDAVGGPR